MPHFHLFLTNLVLLFSTCQSKAPQDSIFPQNKPTDPCLVFLQNLTDISIPLENRSIEVNNTLDYSGHNLNDLGNYKKCSNKSSQAFSLVSIGVSGVSSMMGFCAPSYCSTEKLQYYSNHVIQFVSNMTGKDASKFVQAAFIDPTITGINKGFWLYLSIVLFSALFALVIIGTISANTRRISPKKKESHVQEDLREALLINKESTNNIVSSKKIHLSNPIPNKEPTNRHKSLFIQIAECFNLKENFQDLIKNELEPGHDPNLNVVHGIRALCFGWVVYGHTFTFVTNAKNLLALKMFSKSLWFLVLMAAFYAVDTFFFLSGFFTGFFLLSKLRKMPLGFNSFAQLVIHRFFRLWPAYFLAILFFWKISVHLGDGVLWFTYVKTAQACDGVEVWKNWFFLDSVLSKRNECYSWGWYLSNDFLMFLVAPFICWIYFKNRQRSLYVLWVLYLISTVTGYIYSSNSGIYIMIDVFLGGGKGDSDYYMANYYHNPVVRMTPYILGLYLGLLFKEYKQGNRNIFNWIQESNFKSALCAIIGFNILIFTTFFPRRLQMGDHWENGYAMTWNIFSRTLFAVGIFLIIAPGLVGNLKTLSGFLSNYCFTLVSRVSYSGYLVHLIVLQIIFANTDQFPGLSQGYETLVAFSAFVISCFVAAILHLLIEKPVINIEMRILNKKKKEFQVIPKENSLSAKN